MQSRANYLLVLCCLTGCASVDTFTWVDDVAVATRDSAYVIAPGDLLDIHVWNQEKMSAKVRVRSDGEISLPFLNDFEIAGMAPTTAARQLERKLKDYVINAVVYVSVEESRPMSVSVIGEVTHPGSYPLEAGAGVSHALASAGGLTEFANRRRIFVLRQGKALARIRFSYEALTRAEGLAAAFRLQGSDVVVVE